MIEAKLQAFELINSNEWKLIKELLISYANQLIAKGIQLTAEEVNDRPRTVYIASAKYFEDFIKQLEGQGMKEVQDQKAQGQDIQTVPEF